MNFSLTSKHSNNIDMATCTVYSMGQYWPTIFCCVIVRMVRLKDLMDRIDADDCIDAA